MLKCVFENTLLNTLPVGAAQDKYQPFQSCRTPTGCLRKRWIQGDPGLEAWASLLQAYSLKTPSLIGSLFSPNMSKNAFKKLARGLCCHPGLDTESYPILMLFRMRWRIKSAMTRALLMPPRSTKLIKPIPSISHPSHPHCLSQTGRHSRRQPSRPLHRSTAHPSWPRTHLSMRPRILRPL